MTPAVLAPVSVIPGKVSGSATPSLYVQPQIRMNKKKEKSAFIIN